MPRKGFSRRTFVQTAAAVGAGYWVAGGVAASAKPRSPNDRIRFASIGVGNQGHGDCENARRFGDVVAICDVDETVAHKVAGAESGVKLYHDYRKMLEEMSAGIDAVTVSVPDHNHAAVALLCMRAGKHCYCQKPLTHYIYEADLMGRVAADNKVATQMGNQGTASDSLRDTAAKIRAGALGTVKEVHIWSDRPIWPQGQGRPQSVTPPKTLHWDEWIGPAHYRPFANGYHPISWRGFWDFGTGALGDMACHLMNAPFMALDLFDPTAIEATSSGNNMEMYPNWSIIKWEFPANANRPGVAMYWYDGKKRPSLELFAEDPDIASGKTSLDIAGCLVVGDKGKYYLPGSYNDSGRRLLGGATEPKVEFTRSPGHFEEWVRAINGGEPTVSNFPHYASKLTKTVLLGNLAVSAGRRIEWDAKNMKATNLPDIEPLIRPHYRRGHQLDT